MATGRLNEVVEQLRRAALGGEAAAASDGRLLECFLAGKGEAAFEALVRRHGPMVLGVCRRILGNEADAEDAFQATFLVLVRKAASVRPRERVGNWLYGVAYRTALKARGQAARHRARERAMSRPEATAEGPGHDLLPLLDRELHGLPDRYRVPLVLCELEGKTHQEAARQLGWPVGTLSGRLSRARALLARRLKARGVAIPAAGLAALLAEQASAAVPAALAAATVRAGALLASGKTILGAAASARVAALTEGVLKAMLLTRLKIMATVLLAVGLAAAGAGTFAHQATRADEQGARDPGPPRRPVAEGQRPPHTALEKLVNESDRILVVKTGTADSPSTRITETLKGLGVGDRVLAVKAIPGMEELPAEPPGARWIVFLRVAEEDAPAPQVRPVRPRGWFLLYSDKLLREVKKALPLPRQWGPAKNALRLGLRLRTPRPAAGGEIVVEVCLQNLNPTDAPGGMLVLQPRFNIYDYWPCLKFEVTAPDGKLYVLAKPEGPMKESDWPSPRMVEAGEVYLQPVRLSRWPVQGDERHPPDPAQYTVFARPGRYEVRALYDVFPGQAHYVWAGKLVSNTVPIQVAARRGLSARIQIKSEQPLPGEEIDAALVLTNESDRPLRLCTLVGGMASGGADWHRQILRPDVWKSDAPPPERSAAHVVALAPGKSVALPFRVRFADRGQRAIRIEASYEVGQRFARRFDTWGGQAEAAPVTVPILRAPPGSGGG